MAIPAGPLAAGAKVSVPVLLEVVRDDGPFVAVLIPDGYGGQRDLLVPRQVLEQGEVVGG